MEVRRAGPRLRLLEFGLSTIQRLETVVICLRPGNKQGPPVSQFESVCGQTELRFRYRLVRLWSFAPSSLLAGMPGLLPFIPYVRGATEDHVDAAMARLDGIESLKRRAAELQAALATFAESVFPDVDWIDRMPKELFMASSIYTKGLEQGLEQGRVEGQRHTLAAFVRERLADQGEPLAARLASATQATCDEVTRLLVGERSEAQLVEALDALLPPAPA